MDFHMYIYSSMCTVPCIFLNSHELSRSEREKENEKKRQAWDSNPESLAISNRKLARYHYANPPCLSPMISMFMIGGT